jgi:hypothetical protein
MLSVHFQVKTCWILQILWRRGVRVTKKRLYSKERKNIRNNESGDRKAEKQREIENWQREKKKKKTVCTLTLVPWGWGKSRTWQQKKLHGSGDRLVIVVAE